MSRISYFNCYRNGRTEMHDIDAIFDTEREALDALSALLDILDKYTYVTVTDLYALIGEPSNYMHNKYGCTDLRGTEIIRRNSQYGQYAIHFKTDPYFLGDSIYDEKYKEPKPEPNVSVDILVTINSKKYKLVPVDDD